MSSASALTFAPGDMIADRYRVERVLGRGGMGVVVAATHVDLLERRALKLMLPELAAMPGAVERFLREARAVVRLKSDHVARVHDVGRLPDGVPFIVMEYLDGVDLSRRIRKDGPIEPGVAARYVLEACDAIAEAHAAGIIHRDLKPANLFLARAADGSDTVKVLDFGISKLVATEASEQPPELTHTTSMVGSPFYMSPEQIKSAKGVGPRSDIWSLGVILFQLVTRKLPFQGDDRFTLCMNVVQEPAPAPSSIVPAVPAAFDRIVLRCLSKSPEDRYPSIVELARDLLPLAEGGRADSIERMARNSISGAGPGTTSSPGLGAAAAETRAGSLPPEERASAPNEVAPTGASTAATWGSAAQPSITPRRGRWRLAVLGLAVVLAAAFAATWMRGERSSAPVVAADPGPTNAATLSTGAPLISAAPSSGTVAVAPTPEPVAAEAPPAPSSAEPAPRHPLNHGVAAPGARKTAAPATATPAPPAAAAPEDPFGKDRK